MSHCGLLAALTIILYGAPVTFLCDSVTLISACSSSSSNAPPTGRGHNNVIEGQIQGKKAYGRPRTMLLDWLLKTEEGNISYEELKMFAHGQVKI